MFLPTGIRVLGIHLGKNTAEAFSTCIVSNSRKTLKSYCLPLSTVRARASFISCDFRCGGVLAQLQTQVQEKIWSSGRKSEQSELAHCGEYFFFQHRYHLRCFHKKTMAVAATQIASPGAHRNDKLKRIPDVDIDTGKFKYILIKVHDPDKEREFKHIVRGTSKAGYHADIYDEVQPEIEGQGLDCECVGGGRIEHDPSSKKIKIYGYSQAFGRADHVITWTMLNNKYGKKYSSITFSNDGY